jgi:hypothetical protein
MAQLYFLIWRAEIEGALYLKWGTTAAMGVLTGKYKAKEQKAFEKFVFAVLLLSVLALV